MIVKLPAWLLEGMHTPLKPQMFLWVTQILLLCDSPVWTYSLPKLIPHWSPRQMFPIMSFNAGRHRAEMICTFISLKMIYSHKWDGFRIMKYCLKTDVLPSCSSVFTSGQGSHSDLVTPQLTPIGLKFKHQPRL